MAELQGNVDAIGPEPLCGWAFDPSSPRERIDVEVVVGEKVLRPVSAHLYRADLEAAGIGDGRHGFEVSIADALNPAAEQRVRVERAGSGETIWVGTTGALLERARELNAFRTQSLWAINQVQTEGEIVQIWGYFVPTHEDRRFSPSFTMNGRPFGRVAYPVSSPKVCQRLWYVPRFRKMGFSCRGRVVSEDVASQRPLLFECRDSGTGRKTRSYDEFSLPPDFNRQLESVPPGDRMLRVQGSERADVHLLWGFTAVTKLDSLIRARFGRDLASFRSILDWGCGCGRLTRHLGAPGGPKVTGADVDADNIAWCRQHIEGATFTELPLSPPSNLPAGSFDMIIGLSVFTHLRKEDERRWLGELHRISTENAFLLLTVNSETALWWSDPPPGLVEDWRQRGFTDIARDSALDGLISDVEYYRATFHRSDYIEREWGKYFEVVEILPAFAHIQDLVVLRKRSP